MNGKVLVTGATGFIGTYLVRQLVEEGRSVRVFVRRPEALDVGIRHRLEVVQGDLCNRDALRRAVRGTETVLHLAACAKAWSPQPSEFQDANVRAVGWLLDAARDSDVERLVHVSTALTRDTSEPRGLNGSMTPYEQSKRAGEQLVEAYAAEGRHAVIVHPTRVYGPGPLNDANGVTRVIALYMRGRFRFRIADGDVLANYVHAADVAQGIRLAADRGRSGRHYMLGGEENFSFREFLNQVAAVSGGRHLVAPLPSFVARGAGVGGELWGRLGRPTSLTRAWVDVFLRDLPVDVSIPRSELGYRPRPLTTGLSETIRWLRGECLVKEAA
ncbi:MAG: NAD-dependent epimerase/dehydratase family protein [Gemmatimonadota bacterium]|nr:NAD-dependent epimerase/dehydratase family protein [Gemmatimonadota bacterium]MDH3427146.1 NAD-dependent epimerase/dehydratase family protein [Gemmatimonadota bacterium]